MGAPPPFGPAPSESAFFRNGPDLPADGTAVAVLDLNSINQSNSDQIQTSASARIVVTGHVSLLFVANAAASAEVNCIPLISNGTGPTSGLTAMGLDTGTRTVLAGPAPNGALTETALPINGSAVKPAGTYNVEIRCSGASGGTATINADDGQIEVFSVPN